MVSIARVPPRCYAFAAAMHTEEVEYYACWKCSFWSDISLSRQTCCSVALHIMHRLCIVARLGVVGATVDFVACLMTEFRPAAFAAAF